MPGEMTRCTPDYLMRVMTRRLEARAVLPGGHIVGSSLQMMSSQFEEPLELLICPINLPEDRFFNHDKYGKIFEGVFDVYLRHRNQDDPNWTNDTWLSDPNSGYYKTLHASFLALNCWWPTGDLADAKNGLFLTTRPLQCVTWNEPRRYYTDRTLGQGMMSIHARFVFDQDQLLPTA